MNRLRIMLYVLLHGYTPDEPQIRRLWALLCEAWDAEMAYKGVILSDTARARIWRELVAPALKDQP